VHVVDDGTLVGRYGYTPFDDEGTQGRRVDIIEDGILTSYIHSLETAARLHMEPTGNGRADGWNMTPVVRMRNTYLSPGDYSLEEMMEEMGTGLLCVDWNYGYTDPADGSFMFKARKAYQVENGERGQVYRDAALSGNTVEILARIGALSKETHYSEGTCGKSGQSAWVTDGGPWTLVRDVVIGGQ
jgi:TldD protein